MSDYNRAADMTLARDIAAKASDNETQDNTIYLLSSTKTEHQPGVYTFDFVSGDHYWNRLHYLTRQKAYSNSIFKDGHRLIDNVIGLGNMIIFDIDEGYGINEVQNILREYKFLMVTTSSHQKDKKGVTCDRFRVLLPADERLDMTNAEHKRFMGYLAEELGLDPEKLDRGCFNISAAYKPNRNDQKHWYNHGVKVQIAKMQKFAKDVVKAEESNRKDIPIKEYGGDSKQKIIDALYKIDPDVPYQDWYKIACALKTEFGEEGFAYFDDWSSGGQSYNEIVTQKKWKSAVAGKATGATIIWMAR